MNKTAEEIILVFLRLEAETGNASLGDIATEVGIKKSSIYSHFADFKDLKEKALDYCQNLISERKFEVNLKASDAEELLTNLIHSFANVFATQPICWYYTILVQKHLSSKEYSDRFNRVDMMLKARVQVALEYCVQENWLDIRNTDYASMFLASAIKEKLPVSDTDWEFLEIAHRFVKLFSIN